MENQPIQSKKLPKLTKKEAGFVKDFVETGNGVQSALKNYDTESYKTASNIASTNLDKPRIQNAIKSIAEQIPEEDLIRVHKEGLNAGKTIYKNNNSTGEIEEVGYEPDYAVRHKYLDTAYKLKRLYGDEEKPITKENVYNFFFEPKFQQNIKNYDQNLKEQILNKDAEQT